MLQARLDALSKMLEESNPPTRRTSSTISRGERDLQRGRKLQELNMHVRTSSPSVRARNYQAARSQLASAEVVDPAVQLQTQEEEESRWSLELKKIQTIGDTAFGDVSAVDIQDDGEPLPANVDADAVEVEVEPSPPEADHDAGLAQQHVTAAAAPSEWVDVDAGDASAPPPSDYGAEDVMQRAVNASIEEADSMTMEMLQALNVDLVREIKKLRGDDLSSTAAYSESVLRAQNNVYRVKNARLQAEVELLKAENAELQEKMYVAQDRTTVIALKNAADQDEKRELEAVSEEVVHQLEKITGLGAHTADSTCWGVATSTSMRSPDEDDDDVQPSSGDACVVLSQKTAVDQLRILAGTRVEFQPGAELYITGSLVAFGTPEHPVVLTAVPSQDRRLPTMTSAQIQAESKASEASKRTRVAALQDAQDQARTAHVLGGLQRTQSRQRTQAQALTHAQGQARTAYEQGGLDVREELVQRSPVPYSPVDQILQPRAGTTWSVLSDVMPVYRLPNDTTKTGLVFRAGDHVRVVSPASERGDADLFDGFDYARGRWMPISHPAYRGQIVWLNWQLEREALMREAVINAPISPTALPRSTSLRHDGRLQTASSAVTM